MHERCLFYFLKGKYIHEAQALFVLKKERKKVRRGREGGREREKARRGLIRGGTCMYTCTCMYRRSQYVGAYPGVGSCPGHYGNYIQHTARILSDRRRKCNYVVTRMETLILLQAGWLAAGKKKG